MARTADLDPTERMSSTTVPQPPRERRDETGLGPVDRVLVAVSDDDEARRIERWLGAEGLSCSRARDLPTARRSAPAEGASLIVAAADWEEVFATLGGLDEDPPVLLLIDFADRRPALRAVDMGAVGYVMRPLERDEIVHGVGHALERRRMRQLRRRAHEVVESELRLRVAEFAHREREMAVRLVRALELRGIESAAHASRVGRVSELLAICLGAGAEEAELVRTAASLHDVGKLGIPDGILAKPGPLMPEEEALLRKHTEIGARILGHSSDPLLQTAERIALLHHEAWDGTGYPHGLAGGEIPLEARIAAVAHAWDEGAVLGSEESAAAEMVRAGRGTVYDPAIVDALASLGRDLESVRKTFPNRPAA